MIAQVEMPMYVSHKKVWALKIKEVRVDQESDSCILTFEQPETYGQHNVGYDFYQKHKPEAGGYYVVYADGYQSFSPAQAFEEGYTPVEP